MKNLKNMFGSKFFLIVSLVFGLGLDIYASPVRTHNNIQQNINIQPFAAYRPPAGLEQVITCPPFSMINGLLAREVAHNNPQSFLHILCPELDLSLTDGKYYKKIYRQARRVLRKFVQRGLLVPDTKPAFYIYRQQNGQQSSIAILAQIHLNGYLLGKIKPHELTKPKNERWLQGLLQKQQADIDPVMLFYKKSHDIDAIIANKMQEAPEVNFVSEDGIDHAVWVIHEAREINKIKRYFARLKDVYIADGHHRMLVKSKLQYSGRMHRGNMYTGKEPFNYILAALYAQDEMHVISYNRLVKSLNGLSSEQFLSILQELFTIEAVTDGLDAAPSRPQTFGMYLHGSWYRLLLKDAEINKRKKNIKNKVGTLDASILYDLVLSEIPVITSLDSNNLEIKKTEDSNIICVPGSLEIHDIEKTCKDNKYEAAFVFYPVHVNDIMNIVDACQVMPPKTTFFMPKVRAGLFVRFFSL